LFFEAFAREKCDLHSSLSRNHISSMGAVAIPAFKSWGLRPNKT